MVCIRVLIRCVEFQRSLEPLTEHTSTKLRIGSLTSRVYIHFLAYLWMTVLIYIIALTFSLRGFLVLFDLAQIINLVLIWIKTRYVLRFMTMPWLEKTKIGTVAYSDEHLVIFENGRNHLSSNMQSICESRFPWNTWIFLSNSTSDASSSNLVRTIYLVRSVTEGLTDYNI